MSDWTRQDALQTYNIPRWGEGYFSINGAGHMAVSPGRQGSGIDLYEVANLVRESGLAYPVLVRLPQILHQRVEELCEAFDDALQDLELDARYTPIYPIKVNQNRFVVDELLQARDGRIGLEVGSKSELLAVMAISRSGGTVICNGYKDSEYIRLALAGQVMGLKVHLVIEKLSEIRTILKEISSSEDCPVLGIRLKLASTASGKWHTSGGEKSKFGLTTSQVLQAVDMLRSEGLLERLQLLHLHLGSQVSNIRDIQAGLTEASQYYVELRRAGAPIRIMDVGGGLGVDYEGTRTRGECSMNYQIMEYASKVVNVIYSACYEHDLPMPEIFSESGRAMTAHHAVLITNVTEVDSRDTRIPEVDEDEPALLQEMRELLELLEKDHSLREIYHDVVYNFQDSQLQFTHDQLTLKQRAIAEQLYYAICQRIFERLNPGKRDHRQIFEELEDKLADKVFCNFSLFQSIPDVWAIDQVFPLVPLHRLNEPPTRRGIIHDLTCDSDGRINDYVDRDGVESNMLLHEFNDEEYLLGIFLIGAYQETLGDIHNLFGDTASVNVIQETDGGLRLDHPYSGETVSELLLSVDYDPGHIRELILMRAAASGLPRPQLESLIEELTDSLNGYSYLED